MLDDRQLDAYFAEHFHYRAFRLNARLRYDQESAEVARYLAGEDGPDLPSLEPWLDELRDDTAAGKQWQFVQVFTGRATDWFRCACEWGYPANISAGAQVRILDLTGPAAWLAAEAGEGDFWALDESAALDMFYNEDDLYIGAEPVPPGLMCRYREARDAIWLAAVPLADWWDAHPHYHRKAAAA